MQAAPEPASTTMPTSSAASARWPLTGTPTAGSTSMGQGAACCIPTDRRVSAYATDRRGAAGMLRRSFEKHSSKMKTTKAHRIALLFNANNIFDYEVIEGIAAYMGRTRVAVDYFLEED